MKKIQISATAILLTLTLLVSGTLHAQWSQSGPYVWTSNLNANVGIGTSTPTNASLQFANNLGNKVTLWGTGYNNYGFGINGSNLVAYIPEGASDERFSIRINGYDGPEKFIVTKDGSVGLGGVFPTNVRMKFDNAIGNKIMLFDGGSNGSYGFGINGGNLAAYIPNLPNHRFSIRANSSDGPEKFMVTNEGKVMIGSRLYVGVTGTESGYSLVHFKNGTSTSGGIVRASLGTDDLGNAPLRLESSNLYFVQNGTTRMIVNSAGNVGIGTTNLVHKLNVNGTIRAKEVRVETGWADYVFESDYALRPLEEVEKYIQQHKHLPDVSSAADIQKDGLQVGEQMTQMMQKIEELTLYMIDLKKENTQMQTENAQLKNRLEKLEKK